MKLRLLMADDHDMFREALAALIESAGIDLVAQASNGEEAVHEARRFRPDVALLDIRMPGLNGLDAVREITRTVPTCRAVILSMYSELPYVAAALRAGARGFLLKSQPACELVDALRRVQRGEVCLPRHADGAPALAELDRRAPEDDPLTPREREVLRLIAQGRSTRHLAADLGISIKTAESHRTHLMRKLDIHETAGLVRYAIRRGMVEV